MKNNCIIKQYKEKRQSSQSVRTILLRKAARFQKCDFAVLFQVDLVAHEDDDNVGAGELARVGKPRRQRIVAVAATRHAASARRITGGINKCTYFVTS